MLEVGLYGQNGHQLNHEGHYGGKIRIVAVCGVDVSRIPPKMLVGNAREYATLHDMLRDPRVRMVSLCSPRRSDQAADALRVMRSGKHALCEKPCALTEHDLDMLIRESERCGVILREMCETVYEQPWWTLRSLIRSGVLGDMVQVFVHKSYPMHGGRPQDDETDGGLIRWVGVHALRYVEHTTGLAIRKIRAARTGLGNPVPGGGLATAATLSFTLANGGLGVAALNYLNPKGFGSWGNEHLRVFGTRGMAEITDGGARRRLVLGDRDLGAFPLADTGFDYYDRLIGLFEGRCTLPLTLEEELSPTRWAIRAHDSIKERAQESGRIPPPAR